MLKEYLADNGISIYTLSKRSGIAYSTLNDLVNGKVQITNCKVAVLKHLSDALSVSMDTLYALALHNDDTVMTDYGIGVKVTVRNKSYYSDFTYDGEHIEILLCKVNEATSFYRDYIAKCRTEGFIRAKRMKAF